MPSGAVNKASLMGRRIVSSRGEIQVVPSCGVIAKSRIHGLAPSRRTHSWRQSGSRSSACVSGRSVPLALDQTQTVGARWSSIAPRSARKKPTSMSWCSRGRPVNASIAQPPTTHHGAATPSSNAATPAGVNGAHGPYQRSNASSSSSIARTPSMVPLVPSPRRVNPYTRPMRPTDHRRLVILAEGEFAPHSGKTAFGVIRYGRDDVVAVIDSTKAGQTVDAYMPGHDIPIVASLDDALAGPNRPDALLIGIAPTGGRLPDAWRAVILAAIAAGLDVLSGLHTLIGDDPEFAAAAAARGTAIVDYRRPPDRLETAIGRRHRPGKRVILTVGSDCAIGKMSVALELRRAALAAGDKAVFVPTGQTGMMIEGWGVAVDRLISDFSQGTVEWLVEEGERLGDWVIVEGQGSLDHPAYSSVTLALIHGATPQAMVMVHKPGLAEHDFDHLPEASFPIAKLPGFIAMHEGMANLVAPSKVVAIALNTSQYADDDQARRLISATEAETGLPTDDPYRFGPERLWGRIRDAVDALPWVADAVPA